MNGTNLTAVLIADILMLVIIRPGLKARIAPEIYTQPLTTISIVLDCELAFRAFRSLRALRVLRGARGLHGRPGRCRLLPGASDGNLRLLGPHCSAFVKECYGGRLIPSVSFKSFQNTERCYARHCVLGGTVAHQRNYSDFQFQSSVFACYHGRIACCTNIDSRLSVLIA